VELGWAQPIEDTVADWRKAVAGWSSSAPELVQQSAERHADELALRLRHLVWDPVAPLLPPGMRRIYLGLDGTLALFPFAALPGAMPDTLLLDEVTLGTVPNGPFLLQQLSTTDTVAEPDSFLAVGEVDYDVPGAAQGQPFGFLKYSSEGLLLA